MRPALAAAGALVLAGCAQAQQLGYYPDPWSAAYAYVYQPPIAYGPDGRYTPFVYPDGYDGFHYIVSGAGQERPLRLAPAARATSPASRWRSEADAPLRSGGAVREAD